MVKTERNRAPEEEFFNDYFFKKTVFAEGIYTTLYILP